MNKSSLMKYATLLGIGKLTASLAPPTYASRLRNNQQPIVLYCDLAVDPARESEMLDHFHHRFKPAAEKFDGFIDLKILKIRKVIQGGPPPPTNFNYRFQLTYESEEKRQRWIASSIHQGNWPLIENTVTDKNYLTLLMDDM
jgi:hypothetical protein